MQSPAVMNNTTNEKLIWFPLYMDDYCGGISGMTLAEQGAFMRLLIYQAKRGEIPSDDRKICRVLGCLPDEWEEIKEEVLEKFPEGVNPRMQMEVEKRVKIHEKMVSNGRRGAEKKWQNHSKANGKANSPANGKANGKANGRMDSRSIASTVTVTTKDTTYPSCPKNSDSEVAETPKPIKTDFSREMLEEIWKLSPSKSRTRSSKKKLDDEWKKIKKADRPEPETVISAFQAWLKCDEWTRDGGAYVPGLHLWIKNRQWENIPEAASDLQQYRSCL